MARKSWLNLVWPVAGIDRSISFQTQPPYTTPDAVNVRSEGVNQFRERGGSRPGLGLSFRTQLPGPIRMLTKVGVSKLGWPRDNRMFSGTQLRDTLVIVSGQGEGTYDYGGIHSQTGSVLKGLDFRRGIPVVPGNSATQPYELPVHVRRANGLAFTGSVSINFDLSSSTADPTQDGRVVKLTFSNGTYQAEYKYYVGGTAIQTETSVLFTDNPHAGGRFTVRVTPGVGNIKAYWRKQVILDHGVSEGEGWTWQDDDTHENQSSETMVWQGGTTGTAVSTTGNWSFDVTSSDQSLEVTALTHDFSKDDSVQVPPEIRRDLVVASSEGQLWVEDTMETMAQVPSGFLLRSDVELTSCDRDQLLYVADYGAVLEGESATLIDGGASGYTVLDTGASAASVNSNFALEITDSNYSHNELQSLTVTADGGTYKLGFKGVFTSDLPFNEGSSDIQTALESLSTIGGGNVEVTGTVPSFQVEFKGAFAGADQVLLRTDITSLTATSGSPSIVVEETRSAAGTEQITGTYLVVNPNGNQVNFYPPLPVTSGYTGNITGVAYRVVRTPKIFDPKLNTIYPHLATKGTAPAGCRFVTLYRDRLVYAHTDAQPNVWYMSRQGDPNDWDYSKDDSGAAIFAQSAVAGQLADPITALIAHGDECLIVGSYNSLWIIRGDPGYGGSMDQLSRKIGIIGPQAWCRTPDDMCVFLSHDGLFVVPAGCAGFPTSLSREKIPNELLCLSSERASVSLEYDSLFRGINIMVTRLDGSEGEHWFFDWETKSFWRVKLQKDHEPFSQYERNAWASCPITLQGGRDGYIRHFDRDEEVDDGDNEISSYCYLGPFHLDRRGFTEGMLSELQATLGTGSGSVAWSIHVGDGGQQAFEAAAQESGEWKSGGLNYNAHPRSRGVSACVKVSAKAGSKRRWYLERITAVIRSAGRRRVKGD